MQKVSFLTCKVVFLSILQLKNHLFYSHQLIKHEHLTWGSSEFVCTDGFMIQFFGGLIVLWAYFSSGFPDQLSSNHREKKMRWCAVGKNEKSKCDLWSVVSNGEVECTVADDTKSCIVKIMVWLMFSSFSSPCEPFSISSLSLGIDGAGRGEILK